MLAGGTDALYRSALTQSHQPYLNVQVWRADGSEQLIDDLVYMDGVVDATLTNRVSRTAAFVVSGDLYPFNADDVLNPYSSEVRAYRGVEFADGTRYVWQVFRGRIVEVSLDSRGDTRVQCADRGADVESVRFEVPETSQVGDLVLDEVERLIAEALPDAQFGVSDTFGQTVPQLSWEHERASALDEMATAVGAFWYALADGKFVLRKVPWTVAGSPVVSLSDGQDGFIRDASALRSREEVFNSVTVIGERTDGTTPVFFTARDENPLSATRVDGPFGVRNKLVRLRTPQTTATARTAAEDYLRRTTALTEQWQFTCPPDASMELGDVLGLTVLGHQVVQVVESFTLPLNPQRSMNVSCRSQVIGLLEDTGFDAESS